MQKLYDQLVNRHVEIPSDVEEHQYLFQLLNVLTKKLLETNIPPHKNSRISKCRCALCRYKVLCHMLTKPPFPVEFSLPRKTPNYALQFLPESLRSLDASHSLVTLFVNTKNMGNIERLNLAATTLPMNSMDVIAAMPLLKHLNVSECNVSDAILSQLKDVPLVSLVCANNNLTPTCLDPFVNTPFGNTIQFLDISNNAIKHLTLLNVLKFIKIKAVVVKGTSISQRELKAFVSRHDGFKYNGMQLAKSGQKYEGEKYTLVDEEWGASVLAQTLCSLGLAAFKQEQTNAKASAETVVFTKQK
ncbi:hypothetical protein EIN_181300 [Entamoeba invadens IP1]|uniref:hypothetical protein n=1 Tax=Entamoeba invadens IP1 TaxID=370355 RepID=UPI0002C3F39F|nr:hypothetical protein EIN_181300 [Entamoeba invadens IP1]ELP93973.1 hypothetical protein EIN_181300 [Entamoeba invadens IP1]|eukprot:XP_004260744.1 hypothetical protein EIN_181300 [Entamoeba invadens IP1]